MARQIKSFQFSELSLKDIKQRMLHWANQSNILLYLDSNSYTHTNGTYECLCGVGAMQIIRNDDCNLSDLKSQFKKEKDWLFGHINYDFKNKLELLKSSHKNYHLFEDITFFQPEIVVYILRGEHCVFIESLTISPDEIWNEIMQQKTVFKQEFHPIVRFEKRIKKEEYLKKIKLLKKHIEAGDCYEINFCNEAFCKNVLIDPLQCFVKLNYHSPVPFAAYYKINGQHLLCASPERFLRKEGDQIISQPIKGTAKRQQDELLDERQKTNLLESTKERAEHIMIVDLMRNDLAKICEVGSVKVEELFGLYSFPQVHQMISTIVGKLKNNLTLFDAIRLTFPMGSMTGAPKIIVMKLIEEYESAYRGLFSGCVGYIAPDGNFDFNVVIRSLFYNQAAQYLSYQTGGAITHKSDPLQEWEETILKASAIEKIFSNT